MAHFEQQDFCRRIVTQFAELITDKSIVLDIGSQDINGNNRYLFGGAKYIGIDLSPGKNVDLISSGHDFKSQSKFDVVISTECLEHDKYWTLTVQNVVHNLLASGGLFIMTCATTGRAEHGTTRTSPKDSPFTTDYYMNITEEDFRQAVDVEKEFSMFAFETRQNPCDLYFYGIKK